MQLLRLELKGFKSLQDKTVVKILTRNDCRYWPNGVVKVILRML